MPGPQAVTPLVPALRPSPDGLVRAAIYINGRRIEDVAPKKENAA